VRRAVVVVVVCGVVAPEVPSGPRLHLP
jgi:hypothetical protein